MKRIQSRIIDEVILESVIKIFKSPVSPEIAFAGTGYLKTSLFGSIQHDHEIDINIV